MKHVSDHLFISAFSIYMNVPLTTRNTVTMKPTSNIYPCKAFHLTKIRKQVQYDAVDYSASIVKKIKKTAPHFG